MAVLITEFHAPRLPRWLHTRLFPGVCLGIVTVSCARGTLGQALHRLILRDLAREQPRGLHGRFEARR